MKRQLAFFIALFTVTLTAATDPTAEAFAREYLKLCGTKETMERTIESALASQLKQTPELTPYRHLFLAYFRKCLSYESNEKELVAFYAERFTVAELKELIAFARTPVGQKRARVEAEVGAQLSQITSAKLLLFRPELQKQLQAAIGGGKTF